MDKKMHNNHQLEELLADFFTDEYLPPARQHKKLDKNFLFLRNFCVFAAFILFILQLILDISQLKAIAYFLGAAAYFFEIITITDCFQMSIPHEEMFMTYLFGPMYILLGISCLV